MNDIGLINEIDLKLIQYGRLGNEINGIKATLSVCLLRLYPNEAAFDESKTHIQKKIMEGFPEEKQALMKMSKKDARNEGSVKLRHNAWAALNTLLRKLKVLCYNKPRIKSKLYVANI